MKFYLITLKKVSLVAVYLRKVQYAKESVLSKDASQKKTNLLMR